MESGKMPYRFWSYTAGKVDPYAEERAAARERFAQELREMVPSLIGLGVVLFLTLVMLLMIFAEFRGFYLDQITALFQTR